MTNYVGLAIFTLWGPSPNPRAPGSQSSRGELPKRTRSPSGSAAERRPAGASRPGGRWSRCSAIGGADTALSDEPRLLCAPGAGKLSQAARRRGSKPCGAHRAAEKAATTRRKAIINLTARSSLAAVAACVAQALARSKIRAVLTGGACATLYSRGEYQSSDLDFILQSPVTRRELDGVMETIGFRRTGNHYEHPRTVFFVEFPAGPVGIGADIDVRPVVYRIGGIGVRALSATDSCRDRLAAFYHWKDRQSLSTAVKIARHRKVDLKAIRAWSTREGASEKFSEFLETLRQAPGEGPRPRKPPR
jgi:hypothetical protein